MIEGRWHRFLLAAAALAACVAVVLPSAAAGDAGATGAALSAQSSPPALPHGSPLLAQSAKFTPTFQSGDVLPKEGVFALALRSEPYVIFPVRSDAPRAQDFGGFVSFEGLAAGRYRIVLSAKARLEIFQADTLMPLLSSVSEPQTMEFSTNGGPLILQIRGAQAPRITIIMERL